MGPGWLTLVFHNAISPYYAPSTGLRKNTASFSGPLVSPVELALSSILPPLS